MFAKALITCTAFRLPGIGSTAVFGGTTYCMTGSDRGGYNDSSPRVAQFSLYRSLAKQLLSSKITLCVQLLEANERKLLRVNHLIN